MELRPGLRLEMNKCIRCARCVRICSELVGVHAIEFIGRGFDIRLAFAPLMEASVYTRCDECLGGGALCADTCPTGALTVVDAGARLGPPFGRQKEGT